MSSEAYNFAEGSDHSMALLKILRSSQITLPADLRRHFGLAEGDYLEAQAVKEGILLKPVHVVERQKAGPALGVVAILSRTNTSIEEKRGARAGGRKQNAVEREAEPCHRRVSKPNRWRIPRDANGDRDPG
jgi:AbrB family looped-hinge helix DNA binding protein